MLGVLGHPVRNDPHVKGLNESGQLVMGALSNQEDVGQSSQGLGVCLDRPHEDEGVVGSPEGQLPHEGEIKPLVNSADIADDRSRHMSQFSWSRESLQAVNNVQVYPQRN